MTTASAQANPNLALSNTGEIVTENIAVVTRFSIIFSIQKQGIKIKGTKKRTIAAVSKFPTLLSFKTLCSVRVNNVLPKLGEPATLMALPPVIILPISYFAFKERIGWQANLGTVLAIAGVAVLFLA
jgi:drug/metabolite transporter (DMT)-like permease